MVIRRKRTVTAGSFVRILDRRGTSFCVRLVCRLFIMNYFCCWVICGWLVMLVEWYIIEGRKGEGRGGRKGEGRERRRREGEGKRRTWSRVLTMLRNVFSVATLTERILVFVNTIYTSHQLTPHKRKGRPCSEEHTATLGNKTPCTSA